MNPPRKKSKPKILAGIDRRTNSWWTAPSNYKGLQELLDNSTAPRSKMDEADRNARQTALSEAIRSTTNDVKPSDIISRAQTFYEFLVRPAVKKTRKKK